MQVVDNRREHVLVVGGSSGMGLSLAASLLADGARVTLAGRDQSRLEAARHSLADQERVTLVAADITNEDDVVQLFAKAGPLDHIVTTAATLDGVYRLLPELEMSAIRRAIDSKLIGPLLLAKYGVSSLSQRGSITFTAGRARLRGCRRQWCARIAGVRIGRGTRPDTRERRLARLGRLSDLGIGGRGQESRDARSHGESASGGARG